MTKNHMFQEPSATSLAEIPEVDMKKMHVRGRGLYAKKHPHGSPISLGVLRKALGRTQVEIAQATGMHQTEVSRLERRVDPHVSTLRQYVEALGGTVEVVAVVNGRRYIVDLNVAE